MGRVYEFGFSKVELTLILSALHAELTRTKVDEPLLYKLFDEIFTAIAERLNADEEPLVVPSDCFKIKEHSFLKDKT